MKQICSSLNTVRNNPSPRARRSVAARLVLALTLATGNGLALRSQEIVVPNDLAEADGDSANTTPDRTIGPSGPRTIRAGIYASTTRRSLAEFSTRFDDNLGADNMLVFDGTLVVSTANLPGPGNTRQFDYAWTFTTPFLYDPAAGNLVVDVQIIQSSGSATRLDAVDGSRVARQLSAPGSPTATTGNFSSGAAVTRFSFEPALPITIRTSQIEVCWESVPEATYRVEWRSEVSPGDWNPLANCVRSTGNTTCIHDAVVSGEPRRFYRVVRTACVPQ